MFKEAGLIEKYGTGIQRVLNAFKSLGLPEPHFEEISGGFRVTVYRQAGQVAISEVTEPDTGEVSDQVSDQVILLLNVLKKTTS